jgi:hypothetical protein
MGHALTAADLLNGWERGRSQSPVDRALSLLTLTGADGPIEKLAQWSIGRRDAELLKLREQIFGPRITGQADCPACGGQMELNFGTADICAELAGEPDEILTLQTNGHELRFRLPNSLDLAEISSAPVTPGSDYAQSLLERCLVSARQEGKEITPDRVPVEVARAVSEKMSEADPQGDVQLSLSCPHCGHRWHAPFDIVSFLWSEIHAWAKRLLRDVHVLASAYSWREGDILAMSPWRRQAYLELIEG